MMAIGESIVEASCIQRYTRAVTRDPSPVAFLSFSSSAAFIFFSRTYGRLRLCVIALKISLVSLPGRSCDFFSAFLFFILQPGLLSSYHIPLILLRGNSQTHLTPPLPSVQSLHTNTSTFEQWSTLHTSMIAGIVILDHMRATIDTPIDTAATSHPSHNTPTCTVHIRKDTMSLIPQTSTSTTRYPSTKRRPPTSEQTQGLLLCLRPCHLHHIFNQCP